MCARRTRAELTRGGMLAVEPIGVKGGKGAAASWSTFDPRKHALSLARMATMERLERLTYVAAGASTLGACDRWATRSRTPTNSRIARVPASPRRGLASRTIRV